MMIFCGMVRAVYKIQLLTYLTFKLMKKIDFKNLRSKFKKFWSLYGEFIFLSVSVITAVLVGVFMYCNQLILWLGIAASLTVYWRLLHAHIDIDNKIVRFAWACVNFAVFVAICRLCAIESRDIEYPVDTYLVGTVVAFIVNTLLYTDVIPRLSHKMGFADEYGWDIEGEKTKCNGSLLSIIVYGIIMINVLFVEMDKKNDFLFEKEVFIPVISWDKEVLHESTIYVVETEKGILGISPQKHPEIRGIHKGTKIRVLTDGTANGLTSFSRIEIKN